MGAKPSRFRLNLHFLKFSCSQLQTYSVMVIVLGGENDMNNGGCKVEFVIALEYSGKVLV